MSAGDVRRAIRYLLVAVLAYVLIAISVGHGVHPLEVSVLVAGVVVLVLVAHRLSD